ncbi:FAD-binding domain-containing protein [Lophiostoma macrostomum CBS 122681]|uniref:FAD-binding domain-containing protein n=1 Tax=Lophiostoma macrostomum CBS 122681 TaxID=1314788 RepID=A0A6A6TNU4_9PLEO|nr:FAD-binding domain-containing protein [Lophiostoma macrostomum CBS 122681]
MARSLKSASSAAAVVLSLLLFDGVNAANKTQTPTGFTPCDALINANLSHALHLPSSPLYPTLVNGSWTADTQRSPWCFVVPSTTDEISRTIIALQGAGNGAGDWHIAIRSGGHGSDNQNSITEGVIIDLSHLNATTFDAATKIASVGTGARWGDVYAEVDKSGVLVTGGRQGVVGVGGLLLGGGVSWYTPRNGFACDSVVNYEVVLASGKVINANATAHTDLFRALKGGSSNFGLVTRFDLETFPATNLSVATRSIALEHSDEVVDAVAGFTNLNQSFDDNFLLATMSYSPQTNGTTTISLTEVNTADDANSTAWDALNRIPTLTPGTSNSLSLVEFANAPAFSAGNTRNCGAGPLFIANDPVVLRYCIEQHNVLVADLKAAIGPNAFSTIFDLQPFQSYLGDISVQKGGNILGLERDPRNKIMFVTGVTLQTPESIAQYPLVYQKVAALVQTVEAFAKSVGSGSDFVYLPYADTTQDPLGSYGSANVAHMRSVAAKHDPFGFFQSRVPGGFKLSRVE